MSQPLTKGYKYKLCLLKKYFDTGYGMTNYLKYFVIFFGLVEVAVKQDYRLSLIIGIVYGIACFFLGWLWFKYGWVTAELEIANQFNLFQQEMRKAINGKV